MHYLYFFMRGIKKYAKAKGYKRTLTEEGKLRE